MSEALVSETIPSGGYRKHPLINKKETLSIESYFSKQQFIAPHSLAPFNCTRCSSSNANYNNLIKGDLLNSIADVSNSIYDLTQEIALILQIEEETQSSETKFIPGTEHFVILDRPIKKKIHLQAKIRNIRKASSELGLSDSEWALLTNE